MRGIAGVADAESYVEGFGQLLGHDGKRISGNSPLYVAANWVSEQSLNPYRLAQGRVPRADDEVVVNRGAMKTGKLHLGDTTTLFTPQPVKVHIVGIATFGTADGFGPGTFTGMTLGAAQRYLTTNPGLVNEVRVKPSASAPRRCCARSGRRAGR
jgi:putative ABC transport system permease protein